VIDVPATVRQKALAAGAGAWLEDLEALIESLTAEWSLSLGRVFPSSTEAFVVEATLADSSAAVLKLVIPRAGDAAANEMTALRLADGVGCARLIRGDASRGALLLERLGRSLSELHVPTPQRHAILCATASCLWRPASDCGLPTGAEKGRWLIDFIEATWTALDGPCSERTVEHALACARRRIEGHDDERAVLVHGDVHQWNALEADNGFKLVDPDGLLAEP
jgi:streptomycin 6-kinase